MTDTPTPIGDALKKLDDLPANELALDVSKDAVEADVSKDLGKGWSVGASARWTYDKSVDVAARIKKTWGGK